MYLSGEKGVVRPFVNNLLTPFTIYLCGEKGVVRPFVADIVHPAACPEGESVGHVLGACVGDRAMLAVIRIGILREKREGRSGRREKWEKGEVGEGRRNN